MSQIKVFGDGGLPPLDQTTFEERQQRLIVTQVIHQIGELGYDLPIDYLALVHDLFFATDHIRPGGNVFLDHLWRVATDEYDRVYQIVAEALSRIDGGYSIFSATTHILTIAKYAYEIGEY